VNWSDHYDWTTIGEGLARSLHGAVALVAGEAVGCARLVGDGVHYFYVQDVLVHPDHEGDGLATALVKRLLTWVDAVAPAEAFVGLFSSPAARGVYESLGFREPDDMIPMTRVVRPAGAGTG
jgi:GNAT superfamily N-acetyltransferase